MDSLLNHPKYQKVRLGGEKEGDFMRRVVCHRQCLSSGSRAAAKGIKPHKR